jgi:hypothetical protein
MDVFAPHIALSDSNFSAQRMSRKSATRMGSFDTTLADAPERYDADGIQRSAQQINSQPAWVKARYRRSKVAWLGRVRDGGCNWPIAGLPCGARVALSTALGDQAQRWRTARLQW